MDIQAGPFLKWAGGKAKQTADIAQILLEGDANRRVDTYYEPFLGGGAVFWYLAAHNKFKNAVLNDSNHELMDTYRVVRDFPDDLIQGLKDLEGLYSSSPQFTYDFWKAKDPLTIDPIARAVRMILLNKTGFNGLYRINGSGIFNVPWGKKPRARLFQESTLRACSEVLNRCVSLRSTDFVSAVADARPNDAVYFDPPYMPTSRTASFTGYTKRGFTKEDQVRLAGLFRALATQGVSVALSNADLPAVREIYEGCNMHEVEARRAINCDGAKRGPVRELVIYG